jgi:F1F0 ATPase subunit 2
MNPVLLLLMSFLGGALLGVFYFNSLWKTVKKVTDEGRQGMFMITGYFIRTGIVLAGFYLIMSGRWERMVAALAGFIIAREIMKRVFGAEKAAS